MEMGKMQVAAFGGSVVLTALLCLPYWGLYGADELARVRGYFAFRIFIPSIVIGIVVHELIHGITWATAGGVGMKQIKFGFQWKTLTPYAHSKVPMQAGAYRLGAAMPLIVLGLLPYVYAVATKSPLVLGFGIFFTFAAFGDIMILWLIRHLPKVQLVQDHPTKGGVLLVDEA